MIIQFLGRFVQILFDLMSFAILARVIMSWFAMSGGGGGGGGGGKMKVMLYEITEPVLSVFRKIIPRLGMIDISPLVALLALDFIKIAIVSIILSLGS